MAAKVEVSALLARANWWPGNRALTAVVSRFKVELPAAGSAVWNWLTRGDQMVGVRRDATAILFWALRWQEGRAVSYQALGDLLWGEFTGKPTDPGPSLRELMTYVTKRYGDKWTIHDNGRGFRISPHSPPAGRKLSCALAAVLLAFYAL